MDSQARFEERMAALRDTFVGGLPPRLEAMRAALDAGDRETLHREAHRLAGTGQSYGLPEITTYGRELEHLCRDGAEPPELRRALEKLEMIVASLCPPHSAMG